MLNLPVLPDPNSLQGLVDVLKAVTAHYERTIPLHNQAKSLSHERGLMLDKLYDILIEHALILAQIGALEPIQSLVSDMLANEIENMETLIDINAEAIKMTVEVKEKSHGW